MTAPGAIRIAVAVIVLAVAVPASTSGQQRPPAGAAVPALRPVIAAKEELKNLTLVKSDAGKAVVRFGTGDLLLLSVGDRVARTSAVVRTIEPGRVVLDEVAPGADGRPQQSQIVWRDGETGGTRYRRQPDQRVPTGVRPRAVDPISTPASEPPKPGANR